MSDLPPPTCYYVAEPYGEVQWHKPEPWLPYITTPMWNEEAVRATIASRDEEITRLKKDAERYRWLRDLPVDSPHAQIGNFPGDMWDEAIDAALKEQE